MSKRGNLSADKILDRAIELLDRDGPEKFSMRKLAAEFDVDPMAIYYHIPNRSALMHRVVDTVVSRCELPDGKSGWQQTCVAICRAFRRLAQQHPGVIRTFDGFDDWVAGEHRISEALHAALTAGGFGAAHTARTARLLLGYTENFCAWESTDWIRPYTPEMRSELEDSLAEGNYPVTTKLLDEVVNIDPDAEFEFGLTIMIRGLEASLENATEISAL